MARGKRGVGRAGVQPGNPVNVSPLAPARQPASGQIPAPPPVRVGSPPQTVRAPTPNPTGLVPVVPALRSEQYPNPIARPVPVPSVYPDAAQISRQVLPVAVPVAAPDLAVTVPQSPLETQGNPPLIGEYGTQDSLFGPGYTFSYYGERSTSDLLARNKGWNIYELMLRDDQITASIALLEAFIKSRAWNFEVDDEELQGEAAQMLQYNFSRALHGNIRDLLSQLLSARKWGFAMVEKIIEILPWEGKNWYMLASYKLRPAWTFTFQTDRNGNTLSAVQQQYAQRLQVPIDKFIHAVYQPEYDAQYGRSILIPVFDLWWEKKNTRKFWDIWIERAAAGFVTGEMPPGTTAADRAQMLAGLDNLQAASAFIIPTGGKVSYNSVPHTTAFEAKLEHLNQSIARALLLPSHIGLSEQGSTGSKAQGSTQIAIFENIVDSESAWLEDLINEQLIVPLCAWNFGDSVPAPLFKFERLTASRKEAMAKAMTDALATGSVQRTDEDETRIRDLLGMPARDYDEQVDVMPMPGESPEDAQARVKAQSDSILQAHKEPDGDEGESGGKPVAESVPVEGSGSESDPNDPVPTGGGSSKNSLDPARMEKLSIRTVMERLDVEGSKALLSRQDDTLKGVMRRVSRETFDAMAGQIVKTKDASVTKTLEVPKAVRAKAHKEMVSALQGTYDTAASHAELDLRRSGYRGVKPGSSKGAPGARGKHNLSWTIVPDASVPIIGARIETLSLDETTAAAWLEAHADELLTKLTEDQRKAFVQAWLQGIENDWSEGEIMGQVEKALGGVVNDAWVETAVRTIDASAFNAARRAVFEDPDLGGWVIGYENSSVIDEHTTDVCLALDGTKFPIDSPIWDRAFPPAPVIFNCRRTVIPITKEDDPVEWDDESEMMGRLDELGY